MLVLQAYMGLPENTMLELAKGNDVSIIYVPHMAIESNAFAPEGL